MKTGQLLSFREKVKQTESFKSWGKVVQKVTLSRNNMNHIEHGLTVAKNIGYMKWEKQCQFNNRNKELVKELYNQEIGTKKKVPLQ